MWWFLHWVADTSCPFFLILYFKAFAMWSKGSSSIISISFHEGLIQTQFGISCWIFYMIIFLLLCLIVQLAFAVFCKTKAWALVLVKWIFLSKLGCLGPYVVALFLSPTFTFSQGVLSNSCLLGRTVDSLAVILDSSWELSFSKMLFDLLGCFSYVLHRIRSKKTNNSLCASYCWPCSLLYFFQYAKSILYSWVSDWLYHTV